MRRFLAEQIIKKYNPAIIAIFAKDFEPNPKAAVANVLAKEFIVSKNFKNAGSAKDILSGILDTENKSFIDKAFFPLSLIAQKKPEYPEVIFLNIFSLEMLKDMESLSGFLKFDFMIPLPWAMDKNFVSGEATKKFLKPNTRLVLKFSDKNKISGSFRKKCKILTYSSPSADIFASDLILQSNGGIKSAARYGLNFKINCKGSLLPVRISRSINEKEVCNVLIATLVGMEMGLNLVEIASSFGSYIPAGGMRVIEGIKRSVIIDNSENYNFESAIDVLENLEKLKNSRKIVVAGDILGLGFDSENRHREIAKKIFIQNPDLVFCVGNRANFVFDELRRLRFRQSGIFRFDNAAEVEKILQPKIREDDLILISGSKELGLKKLIRQIMANPMPARLA